MSCVLGFDVGSKLIGVAVGNRITQSARALATIAMREGQPDWPALDRLHREWLPQALVVGLPLTLDGAEQLPAPEETTAGRIVAAGGAARASSASVTDAAAVHELFTSLVDELGRLDAARKDLRTRNAVLAADNAMLSAPPRVVKRAHKLGMVESGMPAFIYLDPSNRPQHVRRTATQPAASPGEAAAATATSSVQASIDSLAGAG